MAQATAPAASGVAARPGLAGECFLKSIPGSDADEVADVLLKLAVEIDEKVDGAAFFGRDAGKVLGEPARQALSERRQFLALPRFVGERKFLGVAFEEEIEGVVALPSRRTRSTSTLNSVVFRKTRRAR
ncbi:MAG: hypothetical protein R3E45_07000 [Rhodocyclaceae bacterium]